LCLITFFIKLFQAVMTLLLHFNFQLLQIAIKCVSEGLSSLFIGTSTFLKSFLPLSGNLGKCSHKLTQRDNFAAVGSQIMYTVIRPLTQETWSLFLSKKMFRFFRLKPTNNVKLAKFVFQKHRDFLRDHLDLFLLITNNFGWRACGSSSSSSCVYAHVLPK